MTQMEGSTRRWRGAIAGLDRLVKQSAGEGEAQQIEDEAVSGGGERSQVAGGGDRRWRGTVSGGGERRSDCWLRGAVSGREE